MTGVLIVCALTVGALAIAGWVVNVAQSAPNLSTLKPYVPGSPSQVFAADGTSLGYIWSPTVHTEIAGSRIPERLKEATIAIEDRRFYQHGALDYQGIVRAAIKDAVKGGNGLQGASTLTMQLVDNTYLPHRYKSNHDLKYKIVQAKLAEQLEAQHSKDWILDNYLNDVPYGTVGGQTAYGVAAASQMFFDKPVQKLSLAQDALLAGLPQAPSEYNPFLHSADAQRRRSEVLQAMVTAGYITQAEADQAATKHLEVKADNTLQVHKDPYVFDFIEQQAARDLCPKRPNNCKSLQQGGLKIYSTIDLRKQALAHKAILDHESLLASQGGPGTAAAGVASVNTANGHILAIATSGSYAADEVQLRHLGPPPAGIVVQDVRADDPDPRRPRQPQQHLLRLQAAFPGLVAARTRHGRCTPPRTHTRGRSTSPRRRSCPTTRCTCSSRPTWAGTSSTTPRGRWASPRRWTATRPR